MLLTARVGQPELASLEPPLAERKLKIPAAPGNEAGAIVVC
jgi:hypothetical protein